MKYFLTSILILVSEIIFSQAQYDVELVQAFHDDELEYYAQDGWLFKNDFEFKAVVKNVGIDTLTSVFVNVDVSGFYQQNSDTVSLLPNQTDTLFMGSTSFIYSDINVSYAAFATGDTTTTNNNHSRNLYLGDWWSNLASRTNDLHTGDWNLGYDSIGMNTVAFEVGALYKPTESFCLSSIDVFIGDSTDVGAIIYCNIYEKTDSGFYLINYFPDYNIASINDISNYISIYHGGSWDSGPYLEANKTYLVTAGHYGGNHRLSIGHSSNYVADSTAYYWNVNNNTWIWHTLNKMPMIKLSSQCYSSVSENNVDYGSMKIYPNPTTNKITIQHSGIYQITDLTGRLVQTGVAENNVPVDVSQLPPGIYSLLLNDTKTKKVGTFIIR